jgi:two-component system, response regulator
MNMNEVEILLVEDNPNDAEMTLRVLRKNHLANNIFHAKDGAEALEFIFSKGTFAERNIENKPKVILLDLKLPKVNGIEVLERPNQNHSRRGLNLLARRQRSDKMLRAWG